MQLIYRYIEFTDKIKLLRKTTQVISVHLSFICCRIWHLLLSFFGFYVCMLDVGALTYLSDIWSLWFHLRCIVCSANCCRCRDRMWSVGYHSGAVWSLICVFLSFCCLLSFNLNEGQACNLFYI